MLDTTHTTHRQHPRHAATRALRRRALRMVSSALILTAPACMTPVLGRSAETLDAGGVALTTTTGMSFNGTLVRPAVHTIPQELLKHSQTSGRAVYYKAQQPPVPADVFIPQIWRVRVGVGVGLELQAGGTFPSIPPAGHIGATWHVWDSEALDIAIASGAQAMVIGVDHIDAVMRLSNVYGRLIVTSQSPGSLGMTLSPVFVDTEAISQAYIERTEYNADGTQRTTPVGLSTIHQRTVSYGTTFALHVPCPTPREPQCGTLEVSVLYTPSAQGQSGFWTVQPAITMSISGLDGF